MSLLDWNFITQRIATGARLSSIEDAQTVYGGGITHVLNVCQQPDYSYHRLTTFHLPQPDDGKPKPTEWFSKGITLTYASLIEPKNRIYIHCNQGNQRGPSMVYCVLRVIGLTPTDAYNLIVRRRPILLSYGTHIGYRDDADRAIKELGYENAWEKYIP